MCSLRMVTIALSSVAIALAMGSRPASAADSRKCDAFTQLSDKAYSDFRALKCGVDLRDPRWKWPPGKDYNYRRFCVGARDETVDTIMQQIQDKISRCQICRTRQNQYDKQEYLAHKYHCKLSPGDKGLFDDSGVQDCMFRAAIDPDSAQELGLPAKEDEQNNDLATRTDQLDKCVQSKQAQILLCQAYVDVTQKAARFIASQCDYQYEDGRFVGTDDVRFDWCMDNTTPLGDELSGFRLNGDPVEVIQTIAAGCHGKKVLKTPAGVARTKPNLGPQPFGNDSQTKASGRNSSSRVTGPGLLESDQGGFSSQAPAASGPAPSVIPKTPSMIDR